MPFAYAAASQKTAAVVMVLRGTAWTCAAWHGPQTSGATRRSPGLMKRTNSGDSRSSAVYVRGGLAEVFQIAGLRGWTCAAFLSFAVPLPPWQSVQESCTTADACIGSMPAWQERQPSSGVCANVSEARNASTSLISPQKVKITFVKTW